MGGRINTILMSVKFGDDLIGSLDFNFTGGVPLNGWYFGISSVIDYVSFHKILSL